MATPAIGSDVSTLFLSQNSPGPSPPDSSPPAADESDAASELERINRAKMTAAKQAKLARQQTTSSLGKSAAPNKSASSKQSRQEMASFIDEMLNASPTKLHLPMKRKNSDLLASSGSPEEVMTDDQLGDEKKDGDDDEVDLTELLLPPKELKKRRLAVAAAKKAEESTAAAASLWLPKGGASKVKPKSSATAEAKSASKSKSASPDDEAEFDPFAFIAAKKSKPSSAEKKKQASAAKQGRGNTPISFSSDEDEDDDVASIDSRTKRPKLAAKAPVKSKPNASVASLTAVKSTAAPIVLDSDDENDDDIAVVSAKVTSKSTAASKSKSSGGAIALDSDDDSSSDTELDPAAMAEFIKKNPILYEATKFAQSKKHDSNLAKKSLQAARALSSVDPMNLSSPIKPLSNPTGRSRSYQPLNLSQVPGIGPAYSAAAPSSSATATSSAASSSSTAPSGGPLPPPTVVSFSVRGADSFKKRFKVFTSTSFQMIQEKLVERMNPRPKQVRLRFDDYLIKLTDTPGSIGIQDDEQIDVLFEL